MTGWLIDRIWLSTVARWELLILLLHHLVYFLEAIAHSIVTLIYLHCHRLIIWLAEQLLLFLRWLIASTIIHWVTRLVDKVVLKQSRLALISCTGRLILLLLLLLLLLLMFLLRSIWRPSFLDFCWDAWLLSWSFTLTVVSWWWLLLLSLLRLIFNRWIRVSSSISSILIHETLILLDSSLLIWICSIRVALICPARDGIRLFLWLLFPVIFNYAVCIIGAVRLVCNNLRLITVTSLRGWLFLGWAGVVVCRRRWFFVCGTFVVVSATWTFLLRKNTSI